VNDSEYADEQECWQEQSKQERAMLRTHGINPPYSKTTENRSGKVERDPGAQHTSNPKRVAHFRGSQMCNSRLLLFA